MAGQLTARTEAVAAGTRQISSIAGGKQHFGTAARVGTANEVGVPVNVGPKQEAAVSYECFGRGKALPRDFVNNLR